MTDQVRPVATGVAAREIGVDPATLWRWAQEGAVRPLFRTPGGHLRWDVVQLRAQLAYSRLDEGEPMTEATAPEKPAIVAAIVTSDLGVLVTRRHDGKPLWGFVTGEIEPGESPADAAVREVKEEAGLVVSPAVYEIGRRSHPKTKRHMIYLACRPTEGTATFVGDPEELAEVTWVDLATAKERLVGLYEPVAAYLDEQLTR